MIGISKLYCGTVEPSDALRYDRDSSALPSHLLQFSKDKKPVVVWNVTRRCNLRCLHCYSQSADLLYKDELTTQEGLALIADCAGFGAPVILFSGGEPLLRDDLLTLVAAARKRGMRAVVSTNGTLITPEAAAALRDAGLSYVGVSIDGREAVHDRFRGAKGAFSRALRGIRACKNAGVKVGLRFTISALNAHEIPGVFALMEQEEIPRVCFYHLAYTGRAAQLVEQDLDAESARRTVELIIDAAAALHKKGFPAEVLTVDNHADGVHLYLRMVREQSPRAADVLRLLRMNGGNGSGEAIACVSWDGSVHPDQFWRHYCAGNVRERPFSRIWAEGGDSFLSKLRNRKALLTGRCGRCAWKDVCNGNLRVRAEAVHGDVWAEDPACYLTETEITAIP